MLDYCTRWPVSNSCFLSNRIACYLLRDSTSDCTHDIFSIHRADMSSTKEDVVIEPGLGKRSTK